MTVVIMMLGNVRTAVIMVLESQDSGNHDVGDSQTDSGKHDDGDNH